MKTVYTILLYLWELPLNLLALIYRYVCLVSVKDEYWLENEKGYKRRVCIKEDTSGSVSLGSHVFIANFQNQDRKNLTIKHELGHTVQSMYLGPAYLLVIGLPSMLWAGMKQSNLFQRRSYYDFYTESWADKIAGIKRTNLN